MKLRQQSVHDRRPSAGWTLAKQLDGGCDLWVPVTPQMLVIAVKELGREGSPLTDDTVAEYLAERYPLRTPEQAPDEVARKLRCACAVGMVLRSSGGYRLPPRRGLRMRLKPQEAAAFWREYVNERNLPLATPEGSPSPSSPTPSPPSTPPPAPRRATFSESVICLGTFPSTAAPGPPKKTRRRDAAAEGD